jgi:hypothetical protein
MSPPATGLTVYETAGSCHRKHVNLLIPGYGGLAFH